MKITESQLRKIIAEEIREAAEMQQQYNPLADAIKNLLTVARASRDDTFSEVKNVMNPEQQKKFENYLESIDLDLENQIKDYLKKIDDQINGWIIKN